VYGVNGTAFFKRFEREADPDNELPPAERLRRAEHAKRAYTLCLAKRAVTTRRIRQFKVITRCNRRCL
jgi:hypothetical protein